MKYSASTNSSSSEMTAQNKNKKTTVLNVQRAKWALEESSLDHLVHLLFSATPAGQSQDNLPSMEVSSSCCEFTQSTASEVDYSYRHVANNILVEECERLSTGQRQCLSIARLLYHATPTTIVSSRTHCLSLCTILKVTF